MVAGTLTYSTKMDTGGLKKGVSTIKSIVVGLGIDKILSSAFNTINASLDGAINRLDILNNFPKVMSNMGISADESKEAIDDLAQRLKGIPTTLDDAVMSVERFTSKNGDVKKSVDIFDAVNNAILAGGASADIQKSALEQLSQAYSKGKPDMMEWRTIQMAMPAQLNQIANAMGKTTDALGEDLRSGKISMNDFIDTIIKLNKEGSGEFASFEQQAKNSTGGIKTSIATAKTAVTRGVANIIQSINEGLASAGLGGIGQIFAQIGSMAENALNFIGQKVKEYLPPIIEAIKTVIERIREFFKNNDFKTTLNNLKNIVKVTIEAIIKSLKPIYEFITKNIIPAIKNVLKWAKQKIDTANIEKIKDILEKLSPIITAVVAGFLAFKTVSVIISVIGAIKTAFTSLFATLSANPIGIAVAAVAALIAVTSRLSEKSKELADAEKDNFNAIQQETQKVKDNKQAWDDLTNAKQNAINIGMNELSNYQNLYNELEGIVDANGKVKEGYEERASFITSILKDALGVEIEMTDGQIEGMQNLRDSIQEVIDKKKAQIILDSGEESYTEAINKQGDAVRQLTDYENKLADEKKKRQEIDDAVTDAQNKYNNALLYGGVLLINQRKKELENAQSRKDTYQKGVEDLENSIKTQEGLIGEYSYNIQQYETNMALAHAGRYEEMSTVSWDYVSNYKNATDAEKAMLEDRVNATQKTIDTLKKVRTDANATEIDAEIAKNERLLTEQQQALDDYNAKTTSALSEGQTIWSEGLGKQLSSMTGAQVEFRDAGDGQVQAYINGVAVGKPKATEEMKKLAENAIQQVTNQKGNADLAGQGLVEGVGNGIGNNAKQSTVFSRIASFGSNLLQTLRNSLEEHSPSKASYKMAGFLLEGFDNGIEDNQKNVLKTIDSFGSEVINRMSNAVELETGKINAKASISSNINKVIQINADFKGNVELDNRKVGRIIAPNVAQTIKAGGLA